jgi:flagella basal body P-ring formation protein FlgA
MSGFRVSPGRGRILLLCLLVAAAVLVAAGAVSADDLSAGRTSATEGRIVVLGEAKVDGAVVYLGDIARLEGAAAKEVAHLELGDAPAPGGLRSFPGVAILAALRASGIDLERVRYVIPPVVRVRRRGQEVTTGAIRAIVEDYLAEQLETGDHGVALNRIEVPGPVRLAMGPYEARVSPQRGARLAGRTRLLVELLQDGRVAANQRVTAHIAVFAEIFVARRGIARGAVIAAEDVVTEQRDVSMLPRGVITRMQDVVGKEARVAISALTPLRHEQVGEPAIVRRGDVVTLLAEASGLRITASGQVQEDAPRGGQVRVMNLGSHAEVIGRVIDANTVAVAF